MLGIIIFLFSTAMFTTITAERLMYQQWKAKDSYYQKKMIDRVKVYKNISTVTLIGSTILCIYLLFNL